MNKYNAFYNQDNDVMTVTLANEPNQNWMIEANSPEEAERNIRHSLGLA